MFCSGAASAHVCPLMVSGKHFPSQLSIS